MQTTTSTSSNHAKVTLAEVKAQFAHWRATRSKVGKIPEDLWHGVRQLTKQYGHSQLATELGLNFQQLRSKLQDECATQQSNKESADEPHRTEFVSAAFSPLSAFPVTPQSPTLELSRPDGTVLKAIGLGHQETLALVERFLG